MKYFKFVILLILVVITIDPAFAQQVATQGAEKARTITGSVRIDNMFANFTSSAQSLINLVQAASYIIGAYLVVNSIFAFSKLGQQGQASLKTPLIMFFSGIGIFALTGSISVVSQTLTMGNGPGLILAPTMPRGFHATASQAMVGVLTFIRLVGYIAFIRGWLMINQSGAANAQPGLLGRGLTHIFGGVAAINVQITAKILANTFAPGVSQFIQ